MTSDFEKAFGEFIDGHEYDQAASALHSMIRISFKAGWLAAIERVAKAPKVIDMIKPRRDVTDDN